MQRSKLKILIITKYFHPAYKAGGPVQSLANMIKHLKDEYIFLVITGDRDFEDKSSFRNVKVNEWNNVFGCKVMYLSPDKFNIFNLKKIMNSINYDIIYLNSFFSKITITILMLKRFYLISDSILLAPRGEFSPGALSIKWFKKHAYILLSKMFNLYKNITWHATNENEEKEIRKYFANSKVLIAPNLSSKIQKKEVNYKSKNIGEASFVFLSRINKKKNLFNAIKLLKEIKGNVVLDIYGPIDDKKYFERCKNVMEVLPNNIKCNYYYSVSHEKVYETLAKYHFFLFPTYGENFGHVILEAFCSGCPVIISDLTPWRNLKEKKVGWDISLNDNETYLKVLQKCVDMNEQEYNVWSRNAFNYGFYYSENSEIVKQSESLFLKVKEG